MTGGSIPLFCLEGVPAFPGASQDEAGLTRIFASSGLLSVSSFSSLSWVSGEEAIRQNPKYLASPYAYQFSSQLALILLLGAYLDPES